MTARTGVRHACVRLLTTPAGPDRRTSIADARTAICIARGVALADIDPASGYDVSERAYHSSRTRWLEEAAEHPDSDWLRKGYQEAAETWARRRPDLATDWPEWDDAMDGGEPR
ncbi:hypothetical protein [Streptomyces reniochalinae]|uniref:Uncharacterized protein n=1 Tax=Streptomyces reniochalinae TaxID=2250578 RepID=A0A367EVY9_9ACTN|nr:hypothetical protein [Streptomyces reniochalinae]RCG21802.1 hypothetical protein DQ392_08830 [Streptomyces reniochalinae]